MFPPRFFTLKTNENAYKFHERFVTRTEYHIQKHE